MKASRIGDIRTASVNTHAIFEQSIISSLPLIILYLSAKYLSHRIFCLLQYRSTANIPNLTVLSKTIRTETRLPRDLQVAMGRISSERSVYWRRESNSGIVIVETHDIPMVTSVELLCIKLCDATKLALAPQMQKMPLAIPAIAPIREALAILRVVDTEQVPFPGVTFLVAPVLVDCCASC